MKNRKQLNKQSQRIHTLNRAINAIAELQGNEKDNASLVKDLLEVGRQHLTNMKKPLQEIKKAARTDKSQQPKVDRMAKMVKSAGQTLRKIEAWVEEQDVGPDDFEAVMGGIVAGIMKTPEMQQTFEGIARNLEKKRAQLAKKHAERSQANTFNQAWRYLNGPDETVH